MGPPGSVISVRVMDPRTRNSRMKKVMAPGAVALLIGACGGSAQVKDDQLARLPAEDRQALLDEQQAINTAESNVQRAGVAVDEAKEFRSIVGSEMNAAKSQYEAAEKASELASRGLDEEGRNDARERQRIQSEHVTAVEAKSRYADSLVDLREAQHSLHEAELDLARARLEREQFDALRARGLGEGLSEQDFVEAEQDAQRQFDEINQRVASLKGQTDSMRESWDEARQQYEATARQSGVTDVPIGAPPPPETLPMPAAKGAQEEKEPLEEQQQRNDTQRQQRNDTQQRQQPIEEPLQEPPRQQAPDTQGTY
jgi:hypothetical protein